MDVGLRAGEAWHPRHPARLGFVQPAEHAVEMRAELSYLSRWVDSLERRIWLHAEGLRKLLCEGDENLLRTVLLNQQIIDKLSLLQERWDAEDDNADD